MGGEHALLEALDLRQSVRADGSSRAQIRARARVSLSWPCRLRCSRGRRACATRSKLSAASVRLSRYPSRSRQNAAGSGRVHSGLVNPQWYINVPPRYECPARCSSSASRRQPRRPHARVSGVLGEVSIIAAEDTADRLIYSRATHRHADDELHEPNETARRRRAHRAHESRRTRALLSTTEHP